MMPGETLLRYWRMLKNADDAVSWLEFLGFDLEIWEGPLIYFPDMDITGPHSATSFHACCFYATMMPDEFAKWQTLRRMGVVK